MTLGGRSRTSRYVDVYRVRDGKATEHWHLPLDPKAEEQFFAGRHLRDARPGPVTTGPVNNNKEAGTWQ